MSAFVLLMKPNTSARSTLESGCGRETDCPLEGGGFELWVLPAYECFKAEPSRGKAIMASFPAWHIQDWIWHDQHPGEDTRNSKDYQPFQEKLLLDCPELQWIRDVADAGKHRGLGRKKPKVEVREVKGTWPRNATPLTMTLDDGTQHDFADVLERVIEFWRAKYFP
jgi:hypothetical protein